MRIRKQNKIKRICFFLLIAAVLIIGAELLQAEAQSCEEALLKCMYDPINSITPAGAAFCAVGYLFCLKYIKG